MRSPYESVSRRQTNPAKGSPTRKKCCSNMSFFQKGGGVPAEPKVLRHFLFALKQSKANKCQCAKRLKTVKKFFLKFLLNNFGKSEKSASKIPKVRGGVRGFWKKNSYLSSVILAESFPNGPG